MGNLLVVTVDGYLLMKTLQFAIWASNDQVPVGWHGMKDGKTVQEDSVKMGTMFYWPSTSINNFYNAEHEKGDSVLVYNTLLSGQKDKYSLSAPSEKMVQYMVDNTPKSAPAVDKDDMFMLVTPPPFDADLFRIAGDANDSFYVQFRQPFNTDPNSYLQTPKYK